MISPANKLVYIGQEIVYCHLSSAARSDRQHIGFAGAIESNFCAAMEHPREFKESLPFGTRVAEGERD
jgi:hypothetical protein